MAKRKRRGDLAGEQSIDMTPMTDCVFLLLIFFMVTTTFIDVKGLIVDLPTGAQQEEQQQKKDVNILISATGQYTVSGNIVSDLELENAIKFAMEEANNKSVIINGDNDASNSAVVYAMDKAVGAGAENMAFTVEQASQ
jgi:biopolymer transport protein ExbD